MKRRDLPKMTVLGLLMLAGSPSALADGHGLQLNAEWVPTSDGLRLRGTVSNSGAPIDLLHLDGNPALQVLVDDDFVGRPGAVSRVGPSRDWELVGIDRQVNVAEIAVEQLTDSTAAELTVTLQGRDGPIELKAAVPPVQKPSS